MVVAKHVVIAIEAGTKFGLFLPTFPIPLKRHADDCQQPTRLVIRRPSMVDGRDNDQKGSCQLES